MLRAVLGERVEVGPVLGSPWSGSLYEELDLLRGVIREVEFAHGSVLVLVVVGVAEAVLVFAVEVSAGILLDVLVGAVSEPVAVSPLVAAAGVVLAGAPGLLDVAGVVLEQHGVAGAEPALGTGYR